MWSMEIILNEPLGQSLVELVAIGREITIIQPFIQERLNKSFGFGIIFRGFHATKVLVHPELGGGLFEVVREFTAVIHEQIGNPDIHRDRESRPPS